MPTSVSCHPEAAMSARARQRAWPGGRRQVGFTLLEVLVVLVLVGLLTALAVPNLQRLAQTVEAATRRDAVLSDIGALGYRAYVIGQSFELGPNTAAIVLRDGRPVLALPAGWRISSDSAVRYSFSGFCAGGSLNLQGPDGSNDRLVLQPPLCRVQRNEP